MYVYMCVCVMQAFRCAGRNRCVYGDILLLSDVSQRATEDVESLEGP